ncbi:MAG: hypothetical protein ACO1O3_07825 [Sphingobium sp.]
MRPYIPRLLLPLLLLALPWPVAAQVVATFYSHEFGEHFPHAFFILKGKTIAEGTPVDINYGFTPKSVTPAILFGSVAGRLDTADARYIAQSDPQFAVTLSDAQYRAMLAVVERWRTRKSPSYNLNNANCVHFVGEAAQAAGLKVTFPKALMKKPRSYLQSLIALNPQVIIIKG